MPNGVALVAALTAAYLAMSAGTIFIKAGAQKSTWLAIIGSAVSAAGCILAGLAGYALSAAP